jgi:hypothetical protein
MIFPKNTGRQAGIMEKMKIAVWNVCGINPKYNEL